MSRNPVVIEVTRGPVVESRHEGIAAIVRADLARSGKWEEAMELFWQVHPARMANDAVTTTYIGGTSTLNRNGWKYQDWLAGFNGGPLRAPMLRIPDRFMKSLRQALAASGCEVTSDPDSAFMVGRHPC